jgi:hypothetical protein
LGKSIIEKDGKYCFICQMLGDWRQKDLERHHVMHGTANRSIADKYGLALWLCHACHHHLHSSPDPLWRDIDQDLMSYAQNAFEGKHGHDKWMQLFMKNYESTGKWVPWKYI